MIEREKRNIDLDYIYAFCERKGISSYITHRTRELRSYNDILFRTISILNQCINIQSGRDYRNRILEIVSKLTNVKPQNVIDRLITFRDEYKSISDNSTINIPYGVFNSSLLLLGVINNYFHTRKLFMTHTEEEFVEMMVLMVKNLRALFNKYHKLGNYKNKDDSFYWFLRKFTMEDGIDYNERLGYNHINRLYIIGKSPNTYGRKCDQI